MIVKLRETDGAGSQVVAATCPAWSACTVHVPILITVTVAVAIVHTDGVVEENVTARLDVADAETVKGATPYTRSAIEAKVMVCGFGGDVVVVVADTVTFHWFNVPL